MSKQSWPTSKQFDQAMNHGIEYALDQIAAGATAPLKAPLSGEWADGLIDRDVAYNVGWPNEVPEEEREHWQEAVNALADEWEMGYTETWRTHLDNQDVAEITARNPEIIDVKRAT